MWLIYEAHTERERLICESEKAHLGHRLALLARKHDHLHQEFRGVSIRAKQTDLTLLTKSD